jgi:ferrous iron transport protein B
MKQIAVLGMPNTGKSTLFNRMTGANANIGNWPGITVDLMMAKVKFGSEVAEMIDLPGIYDLRGFSEDEKVVQNFLENNAINLILMVLNATQLDRQISLALQVKFLGLPTVLLLNMADEASQFGVKLEVDKIAQHLGFPVIPISAKYGDGYEDALGKISEVLSHQENPVLVESFASRFANDQQITEEMARLLQDAVHIPEEMEENLTTKIDRVLLHPFWGLPIFFASMFLMFQIVYAIGTPLQEVMNNGFELLKSRIFEPILTGIPAFAQGFLLDGIYTGITTVLAFIPVILLFFVCMAIIEDSGYLSRSAFLMDALMAKLGLDGRSFVMSLMGFGCNVPAIMGTRVMRSPGLRMLSMLVIPFSLCSARLNVFIFMTTALFSPYIAPFVLFSLYLLSFVAAISTAALFKGQFQNQEPFVLELPPYRFPTVKQMILRSWSEVKHFIRWSNRFIIFGVIAIWGLNNFPMGVTPASAESFSGMIGHITQPVLAPIGINSQLAVALIFGFIAKEIVLGGLAVIYGKSDDTELMGAIAQQVDWVQAYSFMLFTLLYTPCLSTVAVLKTESKKVSFAILSVFWSLALAWISSFIFYQIARRLGF